VKNINEKELASNRNFDNIAIPLDIYISEEEEKFIVFIDYLINQIFNNPEEAAKFAQNPDGYIKAHGFEDVAINMDDSILQFILALADKDIISAIQNNDFATFFQLCKEKSLIKSINANEQNYIKQIIENNYKELTKDEILRTSAVVFFVAAVVGVAVFVWAVAVTHVAAANVAAVATAVSYAAAVSAKTVTTGEPEKPDTQKPKNMPKVTDDHLLKLWMLKNDNTTSIYQFLNEYQKERIDMYLSAIKDAFPDELSDSDLADIRNLIEININR
jgi:hypothetical protein